MISFYDWLAKQKAVRTPLGNFARELLRDKSFPPDLASMDALLEHVRAMPQSSAQTIAIARTAYQTYVRSQSPAPSL
jgi:uncharacterized protein YozE (UPF0346 family)